MYKLTAYDGVGRIKLSPGKRVLPGRKQIWRTDGDHDEIGREGEALPGRPLLRTFMRNGQRLPGAYVGIDEARACAESELARLPPRIRALPPADPPYRVDVSQGLLAYGREIAAGLRH